MSTDSRVAAKDVEPLPKPHMVSEHLFYRLDGSPRFVKRTSDSYWGYFTIESLEIYERMYHELCNMMPESNGYVWCKLTLYLTVGYH